MRDHPIGTELLGLVRRIEDGDETIMVPDDARYRDLMLAAAKAIADRQDEMGDGPEQRERESLCRLLGEEATLIELNQRLAEKIRLGDFDSGAEARHAAARHLWETTRERVRESNPKALKDFP